MNISKAKTETQLLSGTAWITLAEALMLPTGFLTVVFLTRQLGPEGYGLFALAATLIAWIEWGISSIFSQTTIKFIGEASDWRSVAAVVLRAQLGCSLAAALLLAALAPAIARLLHEPTLTPLLWLFALEIPLFNLTQAHQNIMAGLRDFGPQAVVSASRWVTRLLMIVCFVSVGLSTQGAVLGCLAALTITLIVCRCYIRPSLWQVSTFPVKRLAGYAIPLFVSAMVMRLYSKLDIFALKVLGGTTEQAGQYAVAQNLALLGGVMGLSLVSVLIAQMGQLLSQGRLQQAQAVGAAGMRAVWLHLPVAGIVVGSAPEIVRCLFGEDYAAAGPLFAALFLSEIAIVMISVTSAILIASGRPRWTLAIAVPLPIVALAGQALLIPRWGPIGASSATLLTSGIGALVGIMAVYLRWRVGLPMATFGRSGLVFALTWAAASFWPAPGLLMLVLKLAALSVAAPVALGLLGEFDASDRAMLRDFLRKRLGQAAD